MHGDYSRGHEPDRRRGRAYRRVLLQQGRPLLDSDVAASADAILGEVRSVARGLGTGSADLGFLVTPGRLLAIFAHAAGRVRVTAGTADVWVDYRRRHRGRHPALHVAAAGGEPARVSVALLQPAQGRAALWARVAEPLTIGVGGADVALSPSEQPVRTLIGGAVLDPLEISVPAGGAVWLFALEEVEAAGDAPAFSVAAGGYRVDGLVATCAGGRFPEVSFPPSAGFERGPGASPALQAGARVVAYLEVWERHITAVEDPGIREPALGGPDTSARTQLVAQVKVALVTGTPDACAAFEHVAPPGGRLTMAGYTGADNRLYRVEVHRGGELADVQLKWSRDNGSVLVAARVDHARLVVGADAQLAAGDIVEVLSSVVDLGDGALAHVGPDGFVPAPRAVGQLARLVAADGPSGAGDVAFTLADALDPSVPAALERSLHGDLARSGLKLRRWDGILAGGAAAYALDDGLGIELSASGAYRPGEYWQYEARAGVERELRHAPPHGPQRRFAPLALLEFRAADEPLELLAWLDERPSRPASADAVAFDGARVAGGGATVQEALEELLERPASGELVIAAGDDLQAAFDAIPRGGGARVIFRPGTWDVTATVEVRDRGDLVIAGAGAATRLRAGCVDTVLRFAGCGRVRISDLAIDGGAAGRAGDGLAGALAAIDCAGFDAERLVVSCAGAAARRRSAIAVRCDGGDADVRIRDCRVRAGNAQVGVLVVGAAAADVAGNVVSSPQRARSLREALADRGAAGRAGRLLVDDIGFGRTAEFPKDFARGDVAAGVGEDGGPRILACLPEWGNRYVAFATAPQFDAETWRLVLMENPMQGDWGARRAPAAFVVANLRRLRGALVAAMVGDAPAGLRLAPPARECLRLLALELAPANAFTAGGQGIVVAGRGAPAGAAAADPSPDVRVAGNRVLGFAQGIHVATSHGRDEPRRAYRVTIVDNTVHLRVPGLAGARHGIFAGSAYHARIAGNTVELRGPAPATDAIALRGTFGPLLAVRDNGCIGTRNGVVCAARTPGSAAAWSVRDNAHVAEPGGVAESLNRA